MGAHVDRALEERAFFHGKRRGANIAEQDRRLEQLDLAAGGYISMNLPSTYNSLGNNRASDDRIFADDQHSFGVDFSFKGTIELDGAVKVDDAFKCDVFP